MVNVAEGRGAVVTVGELGDELRLLAADLPRGKLAEALGYLESAQHRLIRVFAGSTQPAAWEILGLLEQLIQAVRDAQRLAANARTEMTAFAGTVGTGGGDGAAGGEWRPAPKTGRSTTPAGDPPMPTFVRRQVDAGLVAEAQRQGRKICPEKVVLIGRDGTGRLVWFGDRR
jgi:hypothetical protein